MHAVVLGGGIAGLVATAALAQGGYQVTIVERDELSSDWSPRPGVPQSSQLHNLLGRAQQELESLVPGYVSALRDSGAAFADAALDTMVVEYGVVMPRRSVGLELICAPRPQIEGVLRACVQDQVQPDWWHTRATGLLYDNDRVAEVTTERGSLEADLVVDAMGAMSPLLGWLAAEGHGEVSSQEIPVRQWYVSCEVQRPEEWYSDPTFWLIFPGERGSRGGLVSPLGTDRWVVSLSGADSEPPLDQGELIAHAEELDNPAIAELLSRTTLTRQPTLFRKHTARWNHVEELGNELPGLFFVGDSVASLNPLLGQGISSTAWQARLLRDRLRDAHPGDLLAVTEAAREDTAEPVRAALALAGMNSRTCLDANGDTIPATARLRELCMLCEGDPELHAAMVRMWHLLENPDTVLDWQGGGQVTAAGTTGSHT